MGTSKQRVSHFTGKRRITAGRIRRQFRLLGTEGTTSPEEDPETDCVNVTHGSWPGPEGETSFDTASRRGDEDSHRTAHARLRPGPQEGEDEACYDEFLCLAARQDAVRAEKSQFLAHRATLLAGTQTPLGQRLMECNSMGLGLRSGTLRNRVHALRRYFSWLASSHQVPLDYLELKAQEPCTRVALKVVHQRLVYLGDCRDLSSGSPHSQTSVQQPPGRTLVPVQTGSRAKASTTPSCQSLGSH